MWKQEPAAIGSQHRHGPGSGARVLASVNLLNSWLPGRSLASLLLAGHNSYPGMAPSSWASPLGSVTLSPPPRLFLMCSCPQADISGPLPPVLWGPPALPGRGGLRVQEQSLPTSRHESLLLKVLGCSEVRHLVAQAEPGPVQGSPACSSCARPTRPMMQVVGGGPRPA